MLLFKCCCRSADEKKINTVTTIFEKLYKDNGESGIQFWQGRVTIFSVYIWG